MKRPGTVGQVRSFGQKTDGSDSEILELVPRAKLLELAKLGYTQSYGYFTWKNSKWEIESWMRDFLDPEIAPTYKDMTFPTPRNFKSGVSVPPLVERTLNRTREGPDFTAETYQETMRAIATMITGIDNVVGQITAELETLGLADNTVILYTS